MGLFVFIAFLYSPGIVYSLGVGLFTLFLHGLNYRVFKTLIKYIFKNIKD